MIDSYDTLRAEAEARLKVERSEFIALAFPVSDEAAFSLRLETVEKKYFDATHHCWAYRLFAGGSIRPRSSDAGEPAGTAGKPILSAIEGSSLVDTAVIVIRYFGGVKLGTGGLTRAYRAAAHAALDAAPREQRLLYDRIEVQVPFSALSVIYRMIAPPDVLLVSEHFGDTNVFALDVRRSLVESVCNELAEKRLPFIRRT